MGGEFFFVGVERIQTAVEPVVVDSRLQSTPSRSSSTVRWNQCSATPSSLACAQKRAIVSTHATASHGTSSRPAASSSRKTVCSPSRRHSASAT